MTVSPQISIIMSVFNGEKYLKESIDSILNQSFTDFEFIFVNLCYFLKGDRPNQTKNFSLSNFTS